jgi:hypothetical protein
MASVSLTASGIDYSDYQTVGTGSGQTESSELFDHYEEGGWLPLVKAGGSNMSISGMGQVPVGYYTKLGRQVTVTMQLWGLPLSSSSGAITVEGLPFSNIAAHPSYFVGHQEYYVGAYNPQPLYRVTAGTSTIHAYDVGSSGTWMDLYEIHDLTTYLFYRGGSATYQT